jgi:AsmA protein
MKAFKIIAILFGIALLLVAIPIAVLVSIDVNNYKDVLARAVEKQTGRQLSIQGPIEKSFFPWLGANIGQLQLSNAPGFGDAPFAQLQTVQVKIKLLPLFQRQIVVDQVVVHGLKLQLARNAQGVSNWDDLMVPQQTEKSTQPPTAPPPQAPAGGEPTTPIFKQISALEVGGIDIRDADIVWDDRQVGAHYELSALDLQTGELRLGQPFSAELSMQFKASQPQAQGKLQWSALVDARPEHKQFYLHDMQLVADISAEALPKSPLKLTVAADVDSDLKAQTAQVSKLKFAMLGSELSGNLQASHILDQPDAQAKLQWQVNNAQALISSLATWLPPTVNAELLKNASLQLDASASLGEQTASLQPLTLKLGNLSLQADLQADHIVDNPSYRGSVKAAPFNPRTLLQNLAVEFPPMADEKALTHTALDTQFQGSTDSISLKTMAIEMDDTRITGSATLKQFDDPDIAFALKVNAIDVDRYLPPPPKKAAASPGSSPAPAPASTPAAAAQEEEIPLPMDMLRALKLKGELTVGQFKAQQVKLAQLQLKVNARDGVLHADPVQAQLYQGSSESRITLDVRQDTPQYKLTEVLKGVQFGPLVKDLMQDDYVSGLANVQANITADGNKVSQLKQRLNGSVNFDFTNGVVKYLDLADILIADYAKYLHKALPPDDPGKTTAFRVFKGTAKITNGVVANKDMYLQSARFEVHGEGTVDVAKEILGYTANTQIQNPTPQMVKYDLDKLVGVTILVHFRGTFDELKTSVDWEGTLRTVAKQRVKEEKEKLKEKAKQKLEAEEQKLKDKADVKKEEELHKLEEKLKEKFKKIF